jgi:hypothetical protein
MNTSFRKIIATAMAMMFVLALIGCRGVVRSDDFFDSGDAYWGEEKRPEQTATPTSSYPAASDSENWTIAIYMNGSDLESEGGEATANLESLLSVELPDSINVLIYTGGTAAWQNSLISSAENQIWLARNGSLELLESYQAKSMGDAGTLSEFLVYTQTHYPADKKALFFWNHGAGSIWGFGADELFNFDGLTLAEMASAMAAGSDGQPFELVGFDACLMASVETASIMAPYARYMVASEEVEPGGGWDYSAFFGALAASPGMDGLELGIAISDSFYGKYLKTSMEGLITCSVLDLSKMPALEQALDVYAQDLSGTIVQREALNTLAVSRQRTESYGESPGAASFDMVDLYDFVDQQRQAGQAYSAELMAAIEDVVAYEVSGSQRSYSYGLSIYFPFAAKEYFSNSLNIYDQIDFCPEYKSFITDFASILTNETVTSEVPEYGDTLQYVEQQDYSETGSYFVQLTDEQLEYMCYVYCMLGWYLEDGALIDMGYDSDLVINYDDNTVHDDFEGEWTGLNGQPVAVYVMAETDDYIIYDIPVLYNGEQAVVKGAWIWDSTREENGYYVYTGIFYSSNEYAAPSTRFAIDLKPGDVVTPIYWPLFTQDGYDDYYIGEDIVIGSDGLYLELVWLPEENDYQYGFMFIDVYGNYHYSDTIDFSL